MYVLSKVLRVYYLLTYYGYHAMAAFCFFAINVTLLCYFVNIKFNCDLFVLFVGSGSLRKQKLQHYWGGFTTELRKMAMAIFWRALHGKDASFL